LQWVLQEQVRLFWQCIWCGTFEREKCSKAGYLRPILEAGEKSASFPATFIKRWTIFRPLYDALFELMGRKKLSVTLKEASLKLRLWLTCEVALLTILSSFWMSTKHCNEQMKMLLTRMGLGSKMVVTGDITQIDLPKPKDSGLIRALEILKGFDEIAIVYLKESDIVRHRLVQKL